MKRPSMFELAGGRLVFLRLAAAHHARRTGWVERGSAADRRAVELRLSRAGRCVAEAVADAEEALYEQIEVAVRGHDIGATMHLLAAFIAGRPTDLALKRRSARQLARQAQPTRTTVTRRKYPHGAARRDLRA